MISTKRILQQLKADLIGKDSHRGITLTYAWLANQFGHLALGFIPAFLIYECFGVDAFKAGIYVSLAWLIFETYNFLGPLLLKKESKSGTLYIPKKDKYVFAPKMKNIAFDTFTDVCFFALGAFLFSLSVHQDKKQTILIILLILAVYLIFATRYWFITKMYQFYGRFPFQFRLSQWDFSITDESKKVVQQFLTSKPTAGNHLLVSGTLSTGKTSLGIGILNELSIKHQSCLYVNAMKLYNYFFKDESDILETHEIWNWRTANFLMVDDINPTEPIQNKLMYPDLLLSFIDTQTPINQKNRDCLKNKNVIWVFGSKLSEEDSKKWKNMLVTIGVANKKISEVKL